MRNNPQQLKELESIKWQGRQRLEAYQRAGDRFLAGQLEFVFRELKTDEDVALHNYMIREINTLLEESKPMKQWFILRISGQILNGTGTFIVKAAGWLRLAAQKGVPNE